MRGPLLQRSLHPLTRLEPLSRFNPPSPTRGEGRKSAGLDSLSPDNPSREKEIRCRLSAARFNGTTPRERDCAMFDALRVNALLVAILAVASAVNGIMFYQYL